MEGSWRDRDENTEKNGATRRRGTYPNRGRGNQSRSRWSKNRDQPSSSSTLQSHTLRRPNFPAVFYDKPGRGRSATYFANREKPCAMDFKQLEELSLEDPEPLLMKLLNSSLGFRELLHTPTLSNDYIVLIMRVLSKLNGSAFDLNKTKLLEMATVEAFIDQLTEFIMFLPINSGEDRLQSKYFWNAPNDFFKHFGVYCDMVFSLSPSTALDILPKLIKAAILTVPQLEDINADVKAMMDTMALKLETFEKEINPTRNKKQHGTDESELVPPDDFRNMSLYPLTSEIVSRDNVFVRRNVIDGPYRDVEHYLDIQFRLLREDFVKPLREGITHYMEHNNTAGQNIKIYKNVKFVTTCMVNSLSGIVIQLEIKDETQFKKMIESSRRFMFGSLMCFTADNFQTVIFGRIVSTKSLIDGELVIHVEHDAYKVNYDLVYLMVESSIYFEPYYHVLKALQQLNANNFPMAKYIVEVSREREPPRYRQLEVDLDDGADDHPVQVHSMTFARNLNPAQCRAYCAALNESFAIIQGPPGTGKTFLGLQIVKSLLARHSEWYHGQYPLLVVCFTNHALDQFLEGLLQATTRLVRIGGQSKNEKLVSYNIKHLRTMTQRLDNARSDLNEVHRYLQYLHEELRIANNYDGVVNVLPTFRRILGGRFANVTAAEFKKWMLDARVTVPQTPQRFLDVQNEEDKDDDEYEDLNLKNNVKLDGDIYIVSIEKLKKEMQGWQRRAYLASDFTDILEIDDALASLKDSLHYIEMRMQQGKNAAAAPQLPLLNYYAPTLSNIYPDDRWQLYFYCLDVQRAEKRDKIDWCNKTYQTLCREYAELREMEDVELMRSKLVVGMTTTGAARLHSTLRALKSPIVVVEEAAEIMESHVVTSLTEHCAHLILIGDHQQLRPSTSDYTMEMKYSLGISLFERMIRNNIHCNVLSVQHRMRPEIAKLVAPNIYPYLENHESVYSFPSIRGVDANLYFITHTQPEEECTDQSKSNLHEVTFLLRLAKYLLQSGYNPEDITVIAAYSGQMFAMFEERKKHDLLKDVRITVLDNYQGEESKIILLSLVRNNVNGEIGFLSLENRVCVALSRAREGLYIMGNIDLLCKHSQIWPKVRTVLEEQNSLGTFLTLRCQIHTDKTTDIASETDFSKVSEGGCDLTCEYVLPCGHVCKSQCHLGNRDHDEYQCKEPCTKVLCKEGHVCSKLCFMDCGVCAAPMPPTQMPCGHEMTFPCFQTEFICVHPVSVELPCKHKVDNKPCHVDVEKFPCPYPCGAKLDKCDHVCTKNCHIFDDPDHLEYLCREPCARFGKNCGSLSHVCPKLCFEQCPPCGIVLKRKRSCGHFCDVRCSSDVELVVCLKPCKRSLPCGHPCKLKCHEVCGYCPEKVTKTIPDCGHEVLIECSRELTRISCMQDCSLQLLCGHKCPKKCGEVCPSKCMELVDSVAPLICGHAAKIPCHMNNPLFLGEQTSETSLIYCKHPCDVTLECKHPCSGSCGECYQGRIHKVCSEACSQNLVCGHKCTAPCRQVCLPCRQQCMYKCPHSNCERKCGDVCTPCVKPCKRRCPHQKCTARCSDICNVPPCTEHCKKELKCGHRCLGFCGDPCPPLCLVCDGKELTDICLGYEEGRDRFVLLEECGHVIESRRMETWLGREENTITVKRCPKCSTPLTATRRYSDLVKVSLQDIQKVTVKIDEKIICFSDLRRRFDYRTHRTRNLLKRGAREYDDVRLKMHDVLIGVFGGKTITISNSLIQIMTSKVQIWEQIGERYRDDSYSMPHKAKSYINFLLERLLRNKDCMTAQEVEDYTLELKRLRRILQLGDIEHRNPSVSSRDAYIKLSKELFSSQRYDTNKDVEFRETLEDLSKAIDDDVFIVSDAEMKEIVKPIGYKEGAWYKCRKGHPYAIGVSHCADCDDAAI